MFDIVCISHLRWNFVWQRPQHLLSRMSASRRVLYVEEPVTTEEVTTPRLELQQKLDNLTVVRLYQPASDPCHIGHGDTATAPIYERLLKDYLIDNNYDNIVLWLYTPLGWHFAQAVPHELVVFDVMDHLAGFKDAPRELLDLDPIVTHSADLIFTGGLSLYESRRPYNTHTHLFPSGVDVKHFARAANADQLVLPDDLRTVGRPIIGYFGVIDERIDLSLLAYMAEVHPDWEIVMVGPVAKISRKSLPQAGNLHYLGMKQYDDLPAYLAHFDVAMIPFALNDATRYVSPTKTLEYMAAHKPIVSTPIHDVISLYGSVVRVGHTAQQFVEQVEAALADDHSALLGQEQHLLKQNAWDSIAARMLQRIHERLTQQTTRKEAS